MVNFEIWKNWIVIKSNNMTVAQFLLSEKKQALELYRSLSNLPAADINLGAEPICKKSHTIRRFSRYP